MDSEEVSIVCTGIDLTTCGVYLVLSNGIRLDMDYKATLEMQEQIASYAPLLARLHSSKEIIVKA